MAMLRSTIALHRLLLAGQDESPEADAIRDASDGPWESLSEVERNRVRNHSEDLYSLTERPPDALLMDSKAQAKLNEAFEAKQRGEWDKALELLRLWRAYIAPSLVSYLRGSIWLDAGEPETASLFFEHAFSIQPENQKYLAMFLHALNIAAPGAASKHAEEILTEHLKYDPVVISRAVHIKLKATQRMPESESRQLADILKPILISTVSRFSDQGLSELDVSSYVMAVTLLGCVYESVGDLQSAMEMYSRGLQLFPNNDALLTARGILLYGTSPVAITDLEMALRNGSRLIWPLFFLAHHRLINRQYEDCRKLCERAISVGGSAAVVSEVLEWLAVAQAELGLPSEMVRATFDSAIRSDPSNERAKRNLSAFNIASESFNVREWETRSPGAVRMSSLAERRFAMAA